MEGFVPVEGEPIDDSPLTIGVSCLMSYEHTGAHSGNTLLPSIHQLHFAGFQCNQAPSATR